VTQIKKQLSTYCAIEKASLLERMKLLNNLEQAVAKVNPVEDVRLFINQVKRPEHVHKSSTAIKLLEEEYQRR